MGLRDFFRKEPQSTSANEAVFWHSLGQLCKEHVDGLSRSFADQHAPYIEWASPRFRVLVGPDAVSQLINKARSSLGNVSERGPIGIHDVEKRGAWVIRCSVYPSLSNSDFLNNCPGASFENLIRAGIRTFRRNSECWEEQDYAHWVLMINEPGLDAYVSLLTVWNQSQQVKWIIAAQRTQLFPLVPQAPVIVPVDLMREDIVEFFKGIATENVKYKRGMLD